MPHDVSAKRDALFGSHFPPATLEDGRMGCIDLFALPHFTSETGYYGF